MSEGNGYVERLDLNFVDLEPIKIRVPIGKKVYILHEALAPDLTTLANKRFAMVKYDSKGKFQSMGPIANLDLDLVQLCMYIPEEVPGPNGTKQYNLRMIRQDDGTEIPDTNYRVPITTVRSWTGKVHQKLVAAVKEISNIDQETEEQLRLQIESLTKKLEAKREERDSLKNDLSSTTISSSELPEKEPASNRLLE